jgi:hypothetical protein
LHSRRNSFIVPIHPGTQAAPISGATGNQIVENNRIYDKAKADYTTYSLVTESLCQQLFNAVNPLYYQALEDDDFGYADVTVPQIMLHL